MKPRAHSQLRKYRPWFYAAALYNFLWGSWTVLFPGQLFAWLGLPAPQPLAFWQVVGMFVLVYAPAYYWAGRRPERGQALILIGLLGKLLGPAGFLWSARHGQLPWAFGWTILTNDLIWWLPFALYLKAALPDRAAWRWLVIEGEY